jgi:YD repeat-containing protein
MKNRRRILLGTFVSVVVTAALFGSGYCQTLTPPSAFKVIDPNGIDLASMSYAAQMPSLTIGSSGSGLSRGGEGLHLYEDAFVASISTNYVTSGDGPVASGLRISYDGKSYAFWYGGGHHTPDGYIEYVNGAYQYTKANGDVIELTPKTSIFPSLNDYWYIDGEAVATKVTKADGEVLQYYYERVASGASNPSGYVSLKTIKSSLGWVMRYAALNDTPSPVVDVRMYNASVDYCDVANSSSACTFSRPWYYLRKTTAGTGVKISKNDVDYATYTSKIFQGDRQYNYQVITKVGYPSGRNVQIDYWDKTQQHFDYWYNRGFEHESEYPISHSRVKSVTVGTSTWNYSYDTITGPIATPDIYVWSTTTGPNSTSKRYTRIYWMDGSAPTRLYNTTDELNRTFSQYLDSEGRVTGVTDAEGGGIGITYDTIGRITEMGRSPKPGSGLAGQISSASYPVGCPNKKTCYKPLWVKDEKGIQTDFTYDPVHSGVLTETGPADANGVRPQKRHTYTQLTPKVKNASGVLVDSTPVWRLTKTSVCKSATAANPASCVGTAEEIQTIYAYNNNNLLLTSVTTTAGDNSATATTSYGYDVYGNRIWVDGPRTDVDDKFYTVYDILRRPVYEISIDPDGSAGALKRSVIRHQYDVDGREVVTESGVGNSIVFDADGVPTGLSDFEVKSFKRMTFDASTGLLAKTEVVAP